MIRELELVVGSELGTELEEQIAGGLAGVTPAQPACLEAICW